MEWKDNKIIDKKTCRTCVYKEYILRKDYRNRTDTPCFLCKLNISDNRTVMYKKACQ